MNIEERLKMFGGLISCSSNLNIWTFGAAKELWFSTSEYENEFATFFRLSGCLDYILDRVDGENKPVILSDELDLIWIGELIYEGINPRCVLIVGPFFCTETALSSVENSLDRLNLSFNYKKQMLNILSEVPMIQIETVYQFAKMMHFTVCGENLQASEIQYQKNLKYNRPNRVAKKIIGEEENYVNERLVLSAISEGDLSYKQLIDEDNIFIIESRYSHDVRISKNSAIMFTALSRNAAIDGGLSFKIAKEIESNAVERIEKCDTLGKIYFVIMETIDRFVIGVRKNKKNPNMSKDIQECCLYIKANILEPLTLEDISNAVGYSEYYLTKKFQKETGIKMTDYIKQNKLELAKLYLKTTTKSIQEISGILNFSSSNYFNRVFKEYVNLTPNKYRQSENEANNKLQKELNKRSEKEVNNEIK